VAVLVGTAEIRGTTEPCGCTSDPLGGVARIAAAARGGWWLDAGGLGFDEIAGRPSSPAGAQATLKAAALTDIAKAARAAVGLGPDDLRQGAAGLGMPRQAINVDGIARAEPELRSVGGVRVGLFGVVTPARMKPVGVSARDPVPEARAAVEGLRKKGAEVVVALCGMNRGETRSLVESVPGIDYALVGAEVGEGMPEAEPVGEHSFLVSPADQGRRVARIEVHLRDGGQPVPFAGETARRRDLARLDKKRRDLGQQLETWKRDPTADRAFVAAREAELVKLNEDEKRLTETRPTPPDKSYFTYSLEPLRVSSPADDGVVKKLRELDGKIGTANLAAAQHEPRPPAEAGKPTYVGIKACQRCHKPAVEFWSKTVHSHAWATLVDKNKQYNYDCTGCHATGWLRPGGSHLASVESAGLTNVQCEVCHGPGSKHVAESGLDEPRTIHTRPDDSLCAGECHTREHSDTFQLVPYLRDILGPGHGEKRRAALGPGVTGHELRARAVSGH
jgi:hypothetical protein